jgi:hypothetical protein
MARTAGFVLVKGWLQELAETGQGTFLGREVGKGRKAGFSTARWSKR